MHSTDRGAPFPSISRLLTGGLYWCERAGKGCAVGRTLLPAGGRDGGLILRFAARFRNILLGYLSVFPGSVQNKTILAAETLRNRKMPVLTWCLWVVPAQTHCPVILHLLSHGMTSVLLGSIDSITFQGTFISPFPTLSLYVGQRLIRTKEEEKSSLDPCPGSTDPLQGPEQTLERSVLSPSPSARVGASRCAHTAAGRKRGEKAFVFLCLELLDISTHF